LHELRLNQYVSFPLALSVCVMLPMFASNLI